MDILEEIDVFLSACQLTQDESNNLVFNGITGCFESKYLADWFVNQINFGWKLWQAAKARAVPDLSELQERIAGHQYYHDEHSHMVVDMDDVVKEISGFDSWKAQAVPEGKYILQTFSTYSGVCEDTFNHKNIGVFDSIDAAMFHARNIGLIMNHYGYEFSVIDAREHANE